MTLPDWTDVNLPYSSHGERDVEVVYPPTPDLDAEMTAHFGVSWDATEAVVEGPLKVQFRAEREVIMQADTSPEEGPDPMDVHIDTWAASDDPDKAAFGRNVRIRQEMRQWECNHPLMVQNRKDRTGARLAGTFAGLGFARPGVQVEMADGKQYLIGDVNKLGGVCDDCSAFNSTDIVARYRVLVEGL